MSLKHSGQIIYSNSQLQLEHVHEELSDSA